MQNVLQPKKQNRFNLTFKNLDGQLLLSSEHLAAQTQVVTGFPIFAKKTSPGSFAINFIDDSDNKVSKGIDELINAPSCMTIGMLDMFGNVVESFEFRDVVVTEVLHSGVGIDMNQFSKIGLGSVEDEESWIIKTVYFDYANVINTLHK